MLTEEQELEEAELFRRMFLNEQNLLAILGLHISCMSLFQSCHSLQLTL